MNQSLKKTNINFLCYKNEIAYCKEKIDEIQTSVWYGLNSTGRDWKEVPKFSLSPTQNIYEIYEIVFEKVLQ